MKRTLIVLLTTVLAVFVGGCSDDGGSTGVTGARGPAGATGATGPAGPTGQPGSVTDPVTSVEACLGCHDGSGLIPVGDITDPSDAHYIDIAGGYGPPSEAGYRKLFPVLTQVDVSGSNVVIDFNVDDETGGPVDNLMASDGRFVIARLTAGSGGDPSAWESLMERTVSPASGSPMDGIGPDETQATYERFTTGGAVFQNLGGGSYRYTSAFDPTGFVADGDTLRAAIQLSAGDLPAGYNGWCDFDYSLGFASACGTATLTRDIVQTATCNTCHGATPETQLGIHGGGRTDVEYCVTCHNPFSADPDTGNTVDMTVMVHKIHRGADLNVLPYQIWGYRNSVHDYSEVDFTKEIDNCTHCHTGAGAEVGNWFDVPTVEACSACHDDRTFSGPTPTHSGGAATNSDCIWCHSPGTGIGVDVVHRGMQRATLAATYAFIIDDVRFDSSTDMLEVDYMVTLSGSPMDLAADSEWTAGSASRLYVSVAWDTGDYTNVDSGSTPALPLGLDALDVGGVATDLGGGLYQVVADLGATAASGTVTVSMDGHPASDLDGDGNWGERTPNERVAVQNAFWSINIDGGRAVAVPRRDAVDISKCNACHDGAGQGISLHGNNRTGEMQVCVVCHNPDATDINRRPPYDPLAVPPTTAADGKKEESIDMKRMIHQIHSGAELANGVVIYGYGNSEHDFSGVAFTGNRLNCETCHDPGTYGTVEAAAARASTIDTGTDVADPDDDLNISPIAAVCSSCHDDTAATDHMRLHGSSFRALDADIM